MAKVEYVPRNHVEIMSRRPGLGSIPDRVFVDGVELLLAEEGLDISIEEDQITRVTLTLIPSSISIH